MSGEGIFPSTEHRVIWQQVLKREQVSNPFWLVAVSVTKLPKGLTLVQQIIVQLRTIVYVFF